MATGGGVVRGASLLIVLQIGSRAITFVANQLLLRFMTAQLLGISTQLEVYYLSVLFFARESLRVAVQRQGGSGTIGSDEKDDGTGGGAGKARAAQARETQAVVNLAYISIALGVVVAALLGWMYLASVNVETLVSTPNLAGSLYIYALAAVIELLSEPAFVVMQIRLQFGARAAAESIATFLRCAVTLSSAVWAARRGLELGVLPFALGQLSYGLGLLAVYGWYGVRLAAAEGFSLMPIRLSGPSPSTKGKGDEAPVHDYALSYFYRPTLHLASSMIAQSLVKHILTQGDTFLVSILSTPTAQGVYALANNYGGLAARLVFQPIEESSRSYFSRLLSGTTAERAEKDGTREEDAARKLPAAQTDAPNAAARQASRDLTALLKLYTLFSLLVTTIGPAAAPPLLALVAGPRWAGSGAGATLAAYTWYIPLLAANGVAEAFVSSVATEAEVHTQSAWMGAFSLAFAAAGFLTLRVWEMGAVGLVLANGINMACRIVWCALFISRYFGRVGVPFSLDEIRPSALAVGACVVTSQLVKRVVTAQGGQGPPGQLFMDLVKIAGVTIPFLVVL